MATTTTGIGGELHLDPLTGEPGARPLATGIGSASGAALGATAGALMGPIGMLVVGTLGAIVGGQAGHDAAEQVDPTGEVEYWRSAYSSRPYISSQHAFETDYRPAFKFGVDSRNYYHARNWDDAMADHLASEWLAHRGTSALTWDEAQPAVRDAWDRADRTFNTYDSSDRYFASRFGSVDYREPTRSFTDYRSAYRYGTYARAMHPGKTWDESIDAELARGWPLAKGTSLLTWEQSRPAVKDAWHAIEFAAKP